MRRFSPVCGVPQKGHAAQGHRRLRNPPRLCGDRGKFAENLDTPKVPAPLSTPQASGATVRQVWGVPFDVHAATVRRHRSQCGGSVSTHRSRRKVFALQRSVGIHLLDPGANGPDRRFIWVKAAIAVLAELGIIAFTHHSHGFVDECELTESAARIVFSRGEKKRRETLHS